MESFPEAEYSMGCSWDQTMCHPPRAEQANVVITPRLNGGQDRAGFGPLMGHCRRGRPVGIGPLIERGGGSDLCRMTLKLGKRGDSFYASRHKFGWGGANNGRGKEELASLGTEGRTENRKSQPVENAE